MVIPGQETMPDKYWFQMYQKSQEETIACLHQQLEQTDIWNKTLNNHLYNLTTENKQQRQEILGLRSKLEEKDQEIVYLKGKLPNPMKRIRRRRTPEVKKQRVSNDSPSLSNRSSQESPQTMTHTSTPTSSNALSMCVTPLATLDVLYPMPPVPDFSNYTFTGNVHFDGQQFTFGIGGSNHESVESLQFEESSPDGQVPKPISSFQDALAFWKQNYEDLDKFGTLLFGLDLSTLLFNPNGRQIIPQRVIKVGNEREFQERMREKRGQKWEKLSDFRKNQWKEKLEYMNEIQKRQMAAGLIVFSNENHRST